MDVGAVSRILRNLAVLTLAVGVLGGVLLVLQQHVFGREVAEARPGAAAPSVAGPAPQAAPVAPAAGTTAASAPDGVPLVDPAWLTETATRAGIPEPALLAYARATLQAPDGCSLGWTTLAGIGWIESQHGTIGDRAVGADGRSSTPILGPALDGKGPIAAIPATAESTAWHGNPRWDHAMGPLQFIPSTWTTWSTDGDGDGVADPHDLDDAALAAARYLCADGHDLSTAEGWTAAVFSYNHAQEYVDAVHAAASSYAARVG